MAGVLHGHDNMRFRLMMPLWNGNLTQQIFLIERAEEILP